jgi:hypothetical protein
MGLSLYHSATGNQAPHCIHAIGLGKAGAYMVDALLRTGEVEDLLEDKRARFTALAVDIGDQDLHELRDYGKGFLGRLEDRDIPPERAQIRTVAMEVPSRDDLFASLRRYREYLKLEYPRYYWNPNYEPFLPEDIELPEAGDHFPRALAKAIYNREYYEDGPIAQELDAFAESINASKTIPIVLIVFSLADGVGSGIVVDMARHLSSIKLGRRHIVVGIGVLPSEGDPAETQDGVLFPLLNELDCMLDQEKNDGVMAVWGDLYKNPFTGGFFVAPQTEYVDEGIASFVTQDNGLHIYETLKLLNWLNAPTDQMHPATRAPFTDHWVNVLLSQKLADAENLRTSFNFTADGVRPEYVEARVLAPSAEFDSEADAKEIEDQITSAVSTLVEPDVIHFDTEDESFVHVSVPRLTKLDLADFMAARDAYDQLSWDEKLLAHAWLLDLGTLLCEPSTRFEGVAGECIWGCACWVVVPFDAIRGEEAGERVAP